MRMETPGRIVSCARYRFSALLIATVLVGGASAIAAPANDLIRASEAGDLVTATTLLNSGADPNSGGVYGMTALDFASQNGHVDVVRLLLNRNANVNAKNAFGQTALMSAALNGHREIVEALIAKGADVNVKGSDGKTALMMAAQSGLRTIANLLIAAGADFDAKDLNGKTAEMWAIQSGNAHVFAPVLSNLDKAKSAFLERDFPTAFKEFLALAEAGDRDGQFWLAQMYGQGAGVKQDLQQYAGWLEKAAEAGQTQAQANFGIMNTGTLGHTRNMIAAYMWLSLAAASGVPLAEFNRNSVAQGMTPEQIAEAQKLAREWKPK